MSPIKIHLDRLSQSLTRFGFTPKRAQLVEIAAQAFGYRNSNEAVAAARHGDLDPPKAKEIGQITIAGKALVAFEDPISGQIFATPAKAGSIVNAPLGGLLRIPPITDSESADVPREPWLRTALDANGKCIATFKGASDMETQNSLAAWARRMDPALAESIVNDVSLNLDQDKEYAIIAAYFAKHGGTYTIEKTDGTPLVVFDDTDAASANGFVAMINHKHGQTSYSAASEKALYAKIAQWCRTWWKDAPTKAQNEINLDNATDHEIVDGYFTENDQEFIDICENSNERTGYSNTTIQIAVIHTNSGRTAFSAATEDELIHRIAQWCRIGSPNAETETDDRTIIDRFFEKHAEKMTLDMIEVDNPFA